MTNMPLVSILVAVYNQDGLIGRTLESIFSQTYCNIEIIISDDFSQDNTRSVLSRFAAMDSRVQLFFQDNNLGITNNYNFLASKAKGKYVAIFAGDDIMFPRKIEEQVKLLESYPDASFCHHAVEIFDYRTNNSRGILTHEYNGGVTTIHHVLRNLGVPGSMSIFYRRCLVGNPVFNKDIPTASDWLQIIELTMLGRGLYINHPLCYYGKVSEYNGKDPSRYEDDFLRTIFIVRTQFGGTDASILDSCDYALARYSLGAGYRRLIRGDKIKARSHLRTSMAQKKILPVSLCLYLLSFVPVSPVFIVAAKKLYKLIRN